MKKRAGIILSIICMLASVSAFGQKEGQSIGLKAGDPVGVTYKYYMPDNKAFEVVLGTVPRGWYGGYYRDAFQDEFPDAVYRSHDVEFALAVQGRIMWQNDFDEYIPDSEWYWGVGANLRVVNLDYRYSTGPDFNNTVRSDDTNLDFGPEIFGGGEYFFQEVPLTAFIELGLMLEIVDEVSLRILGGGGIRYNF
jgi:hypothetical protein